MVVCMVTPFVCIASNSAKGGTPICIDVNIRNAKLSVSVCDKLYTEKELGDFLETLKAQFGDFDPVYLLLSDDVSISTMFEVMDVVKHTHRNIHLIVTEGNLQKEMRLVEPDLNLIPSSRPAAPWTTRFLFDTPPIPTLHQRQ